MCRPVITGVGLIAPLGSTPAETWEALLAGRCIRDHALVPNLDAGTEPRVNVLSRRVARQAIAEAQWDESAVRDAGLVIGTSKGPVERWISPPPIHILNSPYERAGESCNFGLAEIAAVTARSLGMGDGPRLTVSAACASGLVALARAAMLIESGEAGRVLVIAVESSVHPLFISSFRRLGVLAPDGVGCRPFDRDRAGFLLSEAAAAVCVESSNLATRPAIAIDRWALAGDATHLTGSDPQGRTVQSLLTRLLAAQPVDLVHAHATGTQANDAVELAAIESALSEVSLTSAQSPAIVYSHKGALGHSLGASGLVSIVLNCLMHRHAIIPPNVQTRSPLPTRAVRLTPSNAPVSREVRSSIALAAGFGGAAAAVSLRSLP